MLEELIFKILVKTVLKPMLEEELVHCLEERGITAEVKIAIDIKDVDLSKFMQNADAAPKQEGCFDLGSVIIRAFRNDEDKE